MQGRDLATFKLLDNGGEIGEPDVVDFAVSCHVRMNGIFCARTSEKRGTASPDWLENFTLSDLPPFDSLVLLIRREKKNMKSIASVTIPLTHFPRGDCVEGWFPVVECGFSASDLQVGELRLKLIVNEEIILPQAAYTPLLETFNSRNLLDWIDDFENKLKVKNISAQLMSLAVDRGVVVSHVQELAAREINEAPPSHQILFRGNTPFTKVMELCMNWYGRAFLETSVASVIRKLCKEKIAIEVDPARRNKGSKDIERNFELLAFWCKEFLDQIYLMRNECPQELRQLFHTIRTLVEKRYKSESSKESRMPPAPVHRSLTLIAKVLQSVANLNTAATNPNVKEEYMRGMAGFISDNTPAMIDYILAVSTLNIDAPGQLPISNNKRRDQIEIETHLRHRSSTMQVLEQETIPRLPYLLDIPRHLAGITSAVIRNSRRFAARTTPRDPADRKLDDLCLHCLDIEEQALLCVSQVKAKIPLVRQTAFEFGQHAMHTCNSSSDTAFGFAFVTRFLCKSITKTIHRAIRLASEFTI
ncbi:hypothetical protein H0H92_007199 [Tricholoma furcatifolium]|nr:hypothetical protein H0H92_007199 [Tricholoma furcatifolium]